jgi:hypothetical protein
MSKKAGHEINVTIDANGICAGTITIGHGTIRVGTMTLGTDVAWECDVTGEHISTLLQEAARNITVRMATIRDLPEAAEKVTQLDGATVAYKDIASWTSKGSKGRRKVEDMSAMELLAKMTPAQREALKELLENR